MASLLTLMDGIGSVSFRSSPPALRSALPGLTSADSARRRQEMQNAGGRAGQPSQAAVCPPGSPGGA